MYISSLIRMYAAWRRQRTAMQQFDVLDDRMLRDIGISRGAVPHAARYDLGR